MICSEKLDGGVGGQPKVTCAAAPCAEIAKATIASADFTWSP